MKTAAFYLLLFLGAALFLSACADHAPVPGGTSAVNESFYAGKDDLLARLDRIRYDMPEAEVFSILEHDPKDLTVLKREDIVMALLGADNITFKDSLKEKDLLQSLYGWRLKYRAVKRVHGFSSPIRVRTNENGFDYDVVFVFRDGRLFEKPIITGGLVNTTSSGTLFDLLNFGTIVSTAK